MRLLTRFVVTVRWDLEVMCVKDASGNRPFQCTTHYPQKGCTRHINVAAETLAIATAQAERITTTAPLNDPYGHYRRVRVESVGVRNEGEIYA